MAIKLLEFTQINQFTLILYGVWILCDVDIFKLSARAQSIHREVYVLSH